MREELAKIKNLLEISCEQEAALSSYVSLLLKWNKAHNLIGKRTEKEIWERHILDCAQLVKYIPDNTKTITDLGSGAGLPGIILAILNPNIEIHLVESNSKKAAFLREFCQKTQLSNVRLHNQRVENLNSLESDIITARAFAKIDEILKISQHFLHKNSVLILLKGISLDEELKQAAENWRFEKEVFSSIIRNKNSRDSEAGFVIVMNSIKKLGG